MNNHKTITFIFFVFSFPLTSISSPQNCPNSACHLSKVVVHFPFRLETLQPESCGYPGFDLSCNYVDQTMLNLPNSGQFTVRAINYSTQEIWINDPGNCLPARILTLNLSNSPFKGVYDQDFTIFNCSSDYRKFKLNPIACLSGTNYTVFATSDGKALASLGHSCRIVRVVSVPVQWPFDERVVLSDLDEDLWLKWGPPSCGRCELKGGRCGFKSNSSFAVGCIGNLQHGMPRSARYAITMGAGVPALVFAAGLICCICGRIRSAYNHHGPSPFAGLEDNPEPIVIAGLDGATINSFPKVVLGHSLRLPRPDFNTCPICLSEYMPEETLRSMPQCQHCFHADCIDEWLRLNPTCPVCRNSPELTSSEVSALSF